MIHPSTTRYLTLSVAFFRTVTSRCTSLAIRLRQLRETHPHSLRAVDITDAEHATTWHSKYKYDIPVLHLDGIYWTKHRVTPEEAEAALTLARQGMFQASLGEPDAERLEGLAARTRQNDT